MNNITIGQYVEGNSWLYKLDPRLKIILTFMFMAIIFMLPNLISMSISFLAFLIIILSARISVIKLIRGIRGILFLLIFTFILQLIYSNTGELLYTVYFSLSIYHILIIVLMIIVYHILKKLLNLKLLLFLLLMFLIFYIQYYFKFNSLNLLNYKLNIYEDGLLRGGYIALRVIFMITLTSLLTITTTSMDINFGLESVLSPLKVIKLPVALWSMMLSLTLRFIPTLLFESQKIMKAQASRGVDFNEGRFKDKVTQIISLLVPMFVISFKRAEDLANAMEARGYVIGAKRTRLDVLKLKLLDYFVLVISLICLALVIWYNVVYLK